MSRTNCLVSHPLPPVSMTGHLILIRSTHRKIGDLKVEGEVSNGEQHDLLEERPEQVVLDVAAEDDPDLHLAVLLLSDDEEVPHLDLVLQQLSSPRVLHSDSILEDAHVLLGVAVDGKVHKAHLRMITSCFSKSFREVTSATCVSKG